MLTLSSTKIEMTPDQLIDEPANKYPSDISMSFIHILFICLILPYFYKLTVTFRENQQVI